MKATILSVTLLAALAQATPSNLHIRQTATSNDVQKGNCQPVTFIMARGSTEAGNMVGELS